MVYCYPGAGGEVAGLRVTGGVPGHTVALHRQLPNQQGGYLEKATKISATRKIIRISNKKITNKEDI